MKGIFLWVLVLFIMTVRVLASDEKSGSELNTWKHESEVGVAVKGGNSSTEIYRFKYESEYRFSEDNYLKGTANYFYSLAGDLEIAKNWVAWLKYERALSNRVRGYFANGYRGDIFSGYENIAMLDAGGKYFLLQGDTEGDYVLGELGYRFQYEDRVPSAMVQTDVAHFIKIYFEASRRINERVTGKLWIEVLPDLSNSSNVQFNFEPSLSVVLMGNFFLKLAFSGNYDGEPALSGSKSFDYIYTTSLVAKF